MSLICGRLSKIESSFSVDTVFRKQRTFLGNAGREETNFTELSSYLSHNKQRFIDSIKKETGYTTTDASDIVSGSIELTRYFNTSISKASQTKQTVPFSYTQPESRVLRIQTKPYGLIATMTPRNAPLILELTVSLNALAAGNAIVLRPSSQCMETAELLSEALVKTIPPSVCRRISILACKATDFLDASYRFADLIHYIGSSTHGKNMLHDSLTHNVKAIMDGEGSSVVVIDESFSLEKAVGICSSGITRCNGELCSSIRLILIPKQYEKRFTTMLIKQLETAKVGPLFSVQQVELIMNARNKYTLLNNQGVSIQSNKSFIHPTLFALKQNAFPFLHEELYGPVAGIVPYTGEGWKQWLEANPYPLNDCVLSNKKSFQDLFISTSRAPRIVINHDPSIESVFEPWGGFLPSGSNDVSTWFEKYRKKIQIDQPLL